jgi:Na+-driven multidrug efflux pump
LTILSWAVFFLFVNGCFTYVSIATNNDRSVALILAGCTVLNVLFNLYFIPRYGPSGAALATLLSEVLMLLFYLIVFSKKDIFVSQDLRGIELPS